MSSRKLRKVKVAWAATNGPTRREPSCGLRHSRVDVHVKKASTWWRSSWLSEVRSGNCSQMNSPKMASALVNLSIVLGRITTARVSR
jgi:hypothetical protein